MEILGRFCRNPQRGVAADLCRMADLHSARSQLLSSSLPGREEAMLRQVSLKVSRRDGMYEPNRAADYLSVGLSAIRCIQRALEEPGRTKDVQSILDFLSGYGRVLRFLRVRFPNADITAGEIDPAIAAKSRCRSTSAGRGLRPARGDCISKLTVNSIMA